MGHATKKTEIASRTVGEHTQPNMARKQVQCIDVINALAHIENKVDIALANDKTSEKLEALEKRMSDIATRLTIVTGCNVPVQCDMDNIHVRLQGIEQRLCESPVRQMSEKRDDVMEACVRALNKASAFEQLKGEVARCMSHLNDVERRVADTLHQIDMILSNFDAVEHGFETIPTY